MRKHKNECEEDQIHEKLQDNKVLDYLVDKSTVDEPLIKRYKNNWIGKWRNYSSLCFCQAEKVASGTWLRRNHWPMDPINNQKSWKRDCSSLTMKHMKLPRQNESWNQILKSQWWALLCLVAVALLLSSHCISIITQYTLSLIHSLYTKASVKAKEHNIGFIQQEQNVALRNLKNSKGLFKMNAMRFFPLLDIPMKPKELLLWRKRKQNMIRSWRRLIIRSKPIPWGWRIWRNGIKWRCCQQ